MSNVDTYNLASAIPNKFLNADGSITDFKGNVIVPANQANAETYKMSKALTNKFLDSNEEIKDYAQISMEIFEVVETLPEVGEGNKIYLVPIDNGMFEEYFWNKNGKWDKIGEAKIDLSNYPTKNQMADAIAANSINDRKYTDDKIKENITNVLGGEY